MVTVWRPKRLTPAQLEERPWAAARLLRAGCLPPGRDRPPHRSELCDGDTVEATRGAGVDWWGAGSVALGAFVQAERGPVAALGGDSAAGSQRASAPNVGPCPAADCRGDLAGIRGKYHPRSLGWYLRARERDAALVEAGLKRAWLRIKKRHTEEGGQLPSWTRGSQVAGPLGNHLGSGHPTVVRRVSQHSEPHRHSRGSAGWPANL
jgi:hypothetical protein